MRDFQTWFMCQARALCLQYLLLLGHAKTYAIPMIAEHAEHQQIDILFFSNIGWMIAVYTATRRDHMCTNQCCRQLAETLLRLCSWAAACKQASMSKMGAKTSKKDWLMLRNLLWTSVTSNGMTFWTEWWNFTAILQRTITGTKFSSSKTVAWSTIARS